MNIENTNVDTSNSGDTEQSLDAFEAEFFSGKAPVKQPAVQEDPVETDETNDNPVEVETTSDTVDDNANDEENDDTPAKQETRAEKRIRELNAKYREEERKRQELEERLAKLEKPTTETPTDKNTTTETSGNERKAPHWDDEDANGNKKYPLGQFDPQFNADLVRFTVQEEQRVIEEQREAREQQRRAEEANAIAQEEWNKKLAPALERYPDYKEKGQELIDQFADLEPSYGNYLTDTIRAIDNGPEVFYHLASNPELAKQIVAKGPVVATVELGRLSAILSEDSSETNKTPARTKVTKAPTPPPTVRGNATPRTKNIDDNLDDFESVFFNKG